MGIVASPFLAEFAAFQVPSRSFASGPPQGSDAVSRREMAALHVVAQVLAFAAFVASVEVEKAMPGLKACVEVARGASCSAGRNAGDVEGDFAFAALVESAFAAAAAAADAVVG